MIDEKRSSKGFTLIEVVAALFIIAVALLAMAKMQSRSIEAAEYGGRMSVALRLAQDVIEQMQNIMAQNRARGSETFTGIESSSNPQTCPGEADQGEIRCPPIIDPEGRIGRFTRVWTVSSSNNWPGLGAADVREVEVTVEWGGRQVRVVTLLTR